MTDKHYIAQVLNTRSSTWSATAEMAKLLRSAAALGLTADDDKRVREMINLCSSGASIPVTIERIRTFYNISQKSKKPSTPDITRVASVLRQEAAMRGLLGHSWMQDALNVLNSLSTSSITVDDESDE